MLQIHTIVNAYQHSCTYILYEKEVDDVWLVDCGEAGGVYEWLNVNCKEIKGVFLTHCHDDHISGLRQLIKDKPTILICLSAHEGIRCVQDIRLNLSKYTADSFRILSDHFIELKDGQNMQIFSDTEIKAIQADGHSLDSMVYRVGDYLFTGDAYIPTLDVVTKLPGADKKRATESLEMIKSLVEKENLTVLPGHDINSKKKCITHIR